MTQTGNTAIHFESKSQLAKLLATENISVQHNPNAQTAYFDIKNRILILPVWQNISPDLYDMLVVHEVGHALDTPTDSWADGIKSIVEKVHGEISEKASSVVKDYMNVIEDARIDKRQKRRYPGSRKNYIVGYKELLDRNFFGIQGKNVNDLALIDRINIHFKAGALSGVQFSAEEKSYINRIAAAETFEEVLQLTEEVYAYANQKHEEQKSVTNQNNQDFDDDELELNEDNSDDDDSFQSSDDEDENDDEEESESDESSDSFDIEDLDEDSEDDDIETVYESEDVEETDSTDLPESITEKSIREKMSSIVLNEDIGYVYLNLPTFNYDLIVDDYKKVLKDIDYTFSAGPYSKTHYNYSYVKTELTDLKHFLTKEKDSISFMVKEFEMRKAADIQSRISVAKTGLIDTNKLHSYKYNEDIFRKLTTVPQGKNHGFVMLLDWSGSMRHDLKHTLKQLFSLTTFCKRVGVPFDVYIFRNALNGDAYDIPGVQNYHHLSQKQFNFIENSIGFEAFKLRNVLSSRMNIAQFNKAMEYLWLNASVCSRRDQLNSTPLNQAIYVASEVVNRFRAKHKVQIVNTIVLTDGDSDPIQDTPIKSPIDPNQPIKKGYKYFLKDPVTGKTYDFGSHSHPYGWSTTRKMIDILRNRTHCTILGFYQLSGRLSDISKITSYEFATSLDTKAKWKQDKFLAIDASGFDEYYIINCRQLSDDGAGLNVNSSMTKGQIAKQFIKYSGKKSVNRILLTKFITRIAGDYKKAA